MWNETCIVLVCVSMHFNNLAADGPTLESALELDQFDISYKQILMLSANLNSLN